MTWPPPSSARPHQAGPGVESSQRATTSCAGALGEPSPDLGQDVERPQVVADGDDEPALLDRVRQAGRPVARRVGGQRLLGQERDRRPRPAARRSPPPDAAARPRRRHPGLALAEHRVDVVVARPAPARRRPHRRSRAVRATTPTSSVRPSRSSASRWCRLIQPPPTRPSRTQPRQPSLPKMLASRNGTRLLELVVAAGLRRLVRAPALERRRRGGTGSPWRWS